MQYAPCSCARGLRYGDSVTTQGLRRTPKRQRENYELRLLVDAVLRALHGTIHDHWQYDADGNLFHAPNVMWNAAWEASLRREAAYDDLAPRHVIEAITLQSVLDEPVAFNDDGSLKTAS